MLRLLVIILCFSLYANNASAQEVYARAYTEEKPLIFEDSEAIWPYSFINDAGEPDGYCVDLLKILMRELEIPFEIRLKPHQTTLTDLQTGKADLILGLGDVYEEHYGHYGRTSVTLLTQSVATHKGANKRVNNFRDLKNQKVYVKDSSLCHHLMIDYGWGQNAIVSHDPAKALQEINDTKEGQMVWNTMTLQWLIDHYKLGGLTLSPVNMPHGETKFLSNDTLLLKAIDDTYFLLSSQGKLSPLEEKWFYPNHQPEKPHHAWIWALTALALVLLIGSIVFLIRELQQNQKATRTYHKQARRLSKMAENDKMRFWTYHIDEEKFEWFGENGMPITTYTADEFATRYNRDDYEKLQQALKRLIDKHLDDKGHEEKEETLELKAKDEEFGDARLHDFVIKLSVLSTDAHGKPTIIVGSKKDVTREHQLQKINTERSLRYLTVFYNNETGILYFNKDGMLENANAKAGQLLNIDVDQAVMNHDYLNSLLHTVFTDYKDADLKKGEIKVGDNTVKYSIKTVEDDLNQLLGIFVFCI